MLKIEQIKILVEKVDINGFIEWSRNYGTEYPDGGNAVNISIDSSGNLPESPNYTNVTATWDSTSSEMRRLIISSENNAGSIKVIEGADEKSLGYGVVSDARFSGQIKLKAASSFSFTANSVTTSASQDANSGGHVVVEGSLTGETKKLKTYRT